MIYTNKADFHSDTKYQDTAPWGTPFCQIVLALKLLYEERSQIMLDAIKKSLKIHNIFIDSKCNDGYPGICGRF